MNKIDTIQTGTTEINHSFISTEMFTYPGNAQTIHTSTEGTLVTLTFDLGLDLIFVKFSPGCIHMTEIAYMQIYTF